MFNNVWCKEEFQIFFNPFFCDTAAQFLYLMSLLNSMHHHTDVVVCLSCKRLKSYCFHSFTLKMKELRPKEHRVLGWQGLSCYTLFCFSSANGTC